MSAPKKRTTTETLEEGLNVLNLIEVIKEYYTLPYRMESTVPLNGYSLVFKCADPEELGTGTEVLMYSKNVIMCRIWMDNDDLYDQSSVHEDSVKGFAFHLDSSNCTVDLCGEEGLHIHDFTIPYSTEGLEESLFQYSTMYDHVPDPSVLMKFLGKVNSILEGTEIKYIHFSLYDLGINAHDVEHIKNEIIALPEG